MAFLDELVPLEGAEKLYLNLDLSVQTVALSLSIGCAHRGCLSLSLGCALLGHGSFAQVGV